MYCSNFSEQVNELVNNGQFNWGTYAADVPNVNMLDAEKPWGFPVPRLAKNMRLKELQAFQLGNDRYFLLAVVYNAKIMGLSQFLPCVPSSIQVYTPIARTDYHGPYGWIEGHIIAADGRKISFDSFFGMGEKKFIQC